MLTSSEKNLKIENADVIRKFEKWKTENADVIKKLNVICIYLKN